MKDPAIRAFFERFTTHAKALEGRPLSEQRQRDTAFFLAHNTCFEKVERIENLTLKDADHLIPMRVYFPSHATNLPILVYFHGGGWVFGNVEQSDPDCRRLANHLNCIVVSVDYRLAPEYPFPQPLNDCYAATVWVASHLAYFGPGPHRLFVSGESAGGNLAGAVSLLARERQSPTLSGQVLFYPAITTSLHQDVYAASPDRYFLTQEAMQFFWSQYLSCPQDYQNPYASLERALSFEGLPPTLLVNAEYDPLRLEADQYATLLRQAGVPVSARWFPRTLHGFLSIPCLYTEEQKVRWIESLKAWIHSHALETAAIPLLESAALQESESTLLAHVQNPSMFQRR